MTQGGKNFARDDGVRGVSTETLREVFRRAGVSYSITLRFPWERLYQQALQQAGHGLYSTVMSDARRNQFKWVGPIAHYDVVLVATADSTLAPASLEQVRGRRIGGYKFGGPSERLAAQGVQTVDALSDSANIRKLLDGEIDLWATADPVWRQYAEQEGAKGLKVVLRLGTEPLYLALNKATPDAWCSACRRPWTRSSPKLRRLPGHPGPVLPGPRATQPGQRPSAAPLRSTAGVVGGFTT